MFRPTLNRRINSALETLPCVRMDRSPSLALLGGFAMLMPAFHRRKRMAGIIGRIIVGFGDLEFILAQCVGEALQNQDVALRTMYRLKSTRGRIDVAETLASEYYAAVMLSVEFAETIS